MRAVRLDPATSGSAVASRNAISVSLRIRRSRVVVRDVARNSLREYGGIRPNDCVAFVEVRDVSTTNFAGPPPPAPTQI